MNTIVNAVFHAFCSHDDCKHYLEDVKCNEAMCSEHMKSKHIIFSEKIRIRNYVLKVVRDGRGRFLVCQKEKA